MQSTTVTIALEHGLHVRPSAQFVEQAKQFESDIELEYEGQKVSAKSIFHLQQLDLAQGVAVTLYAHGPDEGKALECLSKFLKTASFKPS